MAHFFGSLGTKVTIVHRGPLLIRAEGEEVARRLTDVYQRMLLNSSVSRVSVNGAGTSLEVSK